jgi:hypothetical protein
MSKKTKNSSYQNLSTTPIQKHHRDGSVLIPPLADIPNMQTTSWRDDRLPELLWVALLITHLSRKECINLLHQFAESVLTHEPSTTRPFDITFSGLAQIEESVFDKFIEPLMYVSSCREILTGLMVLDDFPGKKRWERLVGRDASEDSWKLLMYTVANTLDHQSQESTDCRWFRVLCFIAGGRLTLPSEEMLLEYVEYPYRGDQRKVRPNIRATEGLLDSLLDSTSNWSKKFWRQCFQDTECWPLSFSREGRFSETSTMVARVREVYSALIDHQFATMETTLVDARHDTVFGMCLYGLTILQELIRFEISSSLVSVTFDRTLTIT